MPKIFFSHTIQPARNSLTDFLTKLSNQNQKFINATLIPIQDEKDKEKLPTVNIFANTHWRGNPSVVFNDDIMFFSFWPSDIGSDRYIFDKNPNLENFQRSDDITLWIKGFTSISLHNTKHKNTINSSLKKLSEIQEIISSPTTKADSKYAKEDYYKDLPDKDELRHNECHIMARIHDINSISITKEDFENEKDEGFYKEDGTLINAKSMTIYQALRLREALINEKKRVLESEEELDKLVSFEVDKVKLITNKQQFLEQQILEYKADLDKIGKEKEEVGDLSERTKVFLKNKANKLKSYQEKIAWINKQIGKLEEEKTHLSDIIQLYRDKYETIDEEIAIEAVKSSIKSKLEKDIDIEIYDKKTNQLIKKNVQDLEVENKENLKKLNIDDASFLRQIFLNNIKFEEIATYIDEDISKIAANYNPDEQDENGKTVIYNAAAANNLEILQFLLNPDRKIKADVKISDNNGVSPLHVATKYGHKDVIELLIKNGSDVNQVMNNGTNPLHIATENGYKELIEILIKNGADIDKSMNNGMSPLHIAAEYGHKDVIELLIKNGADVNQVMNNGTNPLYIAAQNGHIEAVKLLIEKNSEVNKVSNNGATPLYIATQNGHKEVVALLVENEANVDHEIEGKVTPLHIAAEKGYKELIEILIAKGADVNKAINDGRAPLHFAAQNGDKEMVELLIAKGADINKTINNGATPLHIAIENGNIEVSKLLVANEANIDKAAEGKITPLHIAAEKGYKELIEILIAKGADVDKAINDGRTPLYIAAQNGHEEVMEILIEKGADIDKDLFFAIQNGDKEVVELLIAKGADVDKAMNDGRTPLYIAAQNSDKEMIELLIENGADVDKSMNDGKTPLHFAAQNGDKEMIELLIENGADVDKELFFAAQNGYKKVIESLIDKVDDINKTTNSDITLTFIAAQNGHTKVLELLLAKGADINKANHAGATPIYIATQKGDKKTIELLIANKADVNKPLTNTGVTPLYIAIQKNYEEIVKLLIENGADINKTTNVGTTPLHFAAYNGHIKVAELLIENGADINKTKNDGATPLDTALENSKKAVAALLIAKSSNIKGDLAIASSKNKIKVVELLVKSPDLKIEENDYDKRLAFDKMKLKSLHLNESQQIVKDAYEACKEAVALIKSVESNQEEIVDKIKDRPLFFVDERRMGRIFFKKEFSNLDLALENDQNINPLIAIIKTLDALKEEYLEFYKSDKVKNNLKNGLEKAFDRLQHEENESQKGLVEKIQNIAKKLELGLKLEIKNIDQDNFFSISGSSNNPLATEDMIKSEQEKTKISSTLVTETKEKVEQGNENNLVFTISPSTKYSLTTENITKAEQETPEIPSTFVKISSAKPLNNDNVLNLPGPINNQR